MSTDDRDLFDKVVDLWWGKLVVGAVIAGFTFWLSKDLSRLHKGEVESVEVWLPIAFLYKVGGYWGALSIGINLTLVFIGWGIKQLISGEE